MLSTETIKNLNNNRSFTLFKIHIMEEMDGLDSVRGLEDMSNIEAGETARIRAMAFSMLVTLLEPLMNFKEKKNPSLEQIQKKKDKVGL